MATAAGMMRIFRASMRDATGADQLKITRRQPQRSESCGSASTQPSCSSPITSPSETETEAETSPPDSGVTGSSVSWEYMDASSGWYHWPSPGNDTALTSNGSTSSSSLVQPYKKLYCSLSVASCDVADSAAAGEPNPPPRNLSVNVRVEGDGTRRRAVKKQPPRLQDRRHSKKPHGLWKPSDAPKAELSPSPALSIQKSLRTLPQMDWSGRRARDWEDQFLRKYSNPEWRFIDSHCHLDFLFNREYFRGSFEKYRRVHPSFPSGFLGCVAVFCEPRSFTPSGTMFCLLLLH